MQFTPFFSHEDVRRISDSLSIPLDSNPHLSTESKRILKAVRFSREDLDRASKEAAIRVMLNLAK